MGKIKIKKGTEHHRQGDVLIFAVDKIPQGLKKTKKVTLAYGEKTGHHHSITDQGGAVGFADDETGLSEFFEVNKNTSITHQEHDPIDLGQGAKRFGAVIQTEYTPQEIRRVAD